MKVSTAGRWRRSFSVQTGKRRKEGTCEKKQQPGGGGDLFSQEQQQRMQSPLHHWLRWLRPSCIMAAGSSSLASPLLLKRIRWVSASLYWYHSTGSTILHYEWHVLDVREVKQLANILAGSISRLLHTASTLSQTAALSFTGYGLENDQNTVRHTALRDANTARRTFS